MADLDADLQKGMEDLRNTTQGLNSAARDTTKGLEAFGKATVTGAKDITKGLGGFAKSVGTGDTSFKSLNKIVDVAADAMGGMAKTIPYAGEALNAGIKAAAEAAKFMLAQIDQTAKAFNELGSAGALGARGMKGLQEQFVSSGLSLQTFSKLVTENSVALARFKGIASDGADVFAGAVGQLTQGNDDSLRKLGMNAEQIGGTVAAFVTQQTRMGKAQNMTAEQLKKGAVEYALELDKLSRVTGISREQLQKQQDAANQDSRFRANIDEMEMEGKTEQVKQLRALDSRMTGYSAAMGKGMRDLISGSADTDEAQKLHAQTGGAASNIIARVKSGEIDADQANQEMLDAIRRNKGAALNLAKFGDATSGPLGDFAVGMDATNAQDKTADARAAAAQKTSLENTDDLTKTTIEAQKKMEGMNIEINKLGFTFMPQVADAAKAVTSAMNDMVKYINTVVGGKEGATHGGSKATTYASGGGAEGVAVTGEVDLSGGGAASAPPSGQSVSPDKFLKGKSTEGVNKDLVASLTKAARELGRPITVTSALRTPEEQQKLYNDYISGKSKYPAAPPGKSRHASGNAIDIDSGDANALASAGLLAKYGLGRPVANDPVHIQQVSAASGAILSGPMSGYQPNLIMHGTEAIVPMDTPATRGATSLGGGINPEMLVAQLAKLEELNTIFKNQLSVDEKLLAYAS